MASTVTAGTLFVTITERVRLGTRDFSGTQTKSIASVNEIYKRIMTITTNEATIVTMSGAVASAGHFNDSFVRYMRFTNLDDTNFITLTFRNQDNDEAAIKLDAGNSFIWTADNSGGMVDVFNAIAGDAASDTALGSITSVQADANTGNCDLEVFIASV